MNEWSEYVCVVREDIFGHELTIVHTSHNKNKLKEEKKEKRKKFTKRTETQLKQINNNFTK